jgi:hypothetical protein
VALNRRIAREIGWILVTAVIGLVALVGAMLVLDALRGMGAPIPQLHSLVRQWTKHGPAAWISLGLMAAALSSAARAAHALRRRDDPPNATARELRILAVSGAVSTAAFVATAIGSVQITRDGGATENMYFSAYRTEHEVVMWSMTGAGLLLLALLWGVVGVASARRESAGSAARIVTILGLASVVSVAAASLLRWWAAIPSINNDTEWMVPSRRYELILGTGDALVQGRLALIVVAAIAAVGVLLASRRPRPAASRETIAAAGLFVVGLVAFALTRAAAHDALHPLPYWDGSAAGWLDDAVVASLPPGEKCALGLQDQPTIVLTDDGRVRFNGSLPQGPIELQETLKKQRDLWLQVQPHKQFQGRLEAVFAADGLIVLVAPIIEAARAAGYAGIDVIEAMPRRTYVTRTLGEISYRPRVCYVPISLDVALPRQGTWGDFARTLPAPEPAPSPAPRTPHERL